MVTKREIEEYIKRIPPKPDVVSRTLVEVEKKDLRKASEIAKEDPILTGYMRNLINKPIFGLRHKVKDLTQIFSILGTDAVYELLHHYLLTLLSPKQWRVFSLNESLFRELQANLSFYWNRIVVYEGINERDVISAVSLLPLSIVVCDELFHNSKNEIDILSDSSVIDYDFLLHNLTGVHLRNLTAQIGKYWGFSDRALDIVRASSRDSGVSDEEIVKLGQWMHLLLFYVLSKPQFINTDLNTFIKFDTEYIAPIYNDFAEVFAEEME
jgi:hypothetical protein